MQLLIAHCMALPAEQGLVVALEILDERFGDERVYMNQSRERLSEVDVPHTHTHTHCKHPTVFFLDRYSLLT